MLDAAMPYGRDFLARNGMTGINCGCGRALAAGCLNVDEKEFSDPQGATSAPGRILRIELGDQALYYMQHDLAQPFPFADGCFSWGYSEHFIEHVPPLQAIGWLKEMRRLIAPGGLLRVTTPDLGKYVQGYADPKQAFFKRHLERLEALAPGRSWAAPRRAWMVNQVFQFYGHQWIYDFEELAHAAGKAGFDPKGITQAGFQSGRLEAAFMLDSAERSDETLYVDIET